MLASSSIWNDWDACTRLTHRTAAQSRNQHGHLLAIPLVFRVHLHQVALFQLNCDQDVGRGHDRKEQVGDGHCGRAPEGEKPADIQGVSNDAIEKRRRESETGLWLPQEM